jgi:esterase/lipase superfamily enzyme
MTRLKRRMLLGTVLTVLVVMVLAAWFYVPTRNALQRAESFQFRRMLVTQADDETYRFFYITNRVLGAGDERLEDRFRNEREEALKFGFFDTHIEPTLGIGMIINPSQWFQDEEIRISNIQILEQATFVAQLREQVQESPHGSLLINVNGFRERFPSALRKTAFLAHVLDINSPVLVFDWPGDQGSTLRGYRRAQRVARASGEDLARALELIIRQVQPERLSLVANSMGGQVVVDAFSILYQEADLADAETEIEDVVLTAPDIDRDEFNDQFKKEITALTTNLTVYVSSNDRALLMSRIINRGRRLGESTVDTLNPDQFEEAASVLQLIEPDSDLITLVDVTPINRTRNFHNFNLETPEFFDDLYLRLTNTDTPRSRLQYQIHMPDDRVYWVLTRGR